MANKYYNLTKIKNFADKHGATYRLIIGQRSNGKTYACLREGLKKYFETGLKIAYVRRYKEDITKPNLETLFNPHIEYMTMLTGGKWNGFDYRSRQFRPMFIPDNDSDEPAKGGVICDTFSLSAWERQKGSDKGIYSMIIFDEFITRDSYLAHETDILLDVISSIVRDREGVPVYMIANTVSQHCPYFAAFGFKIQDIKQGDIKQVSPLCVIEYCNATGKQNNLSYFSAFGTNHGKMIMSGEWDFREYPTLYPRSHKDYNFHLRFFIVLSDRKIAGEVLTGERGAFIYFYPFTGEIRKPSTTIIYSGAIDDNVLHCTKVSDIPTSAHQIIRDLILAGKCFYSDNETGDGVNAFLTNGGAI